MGICRDIHIHIYIYADCIGFLIRIMSPISRKHRMLGVIAAREQGMEKEVEAPHIGAIGIQSSIPS